MKMILLSGGSGKRLWPLSNDSRAKQFLKVLRNEENGQLESMVQRVYRQLCKVVREDDMIIATNAAQVDILRNQLGRIPIVVEPERRDTFPAIALACSYLWSKLGIAKDEMVAVVSVDAFVNDEFYRQVGELEPLLRQTGAEVALLGIKPTYPSSKYGYMIPKVHEEYMQVAHFIEKPTEEKAQLLIDSGSYWNSGVFVFSLQLIYDYLQAGQFPYEFDELTANFSLLPKTSFDYAVIEHLNHIVALTYDGDWKDLGTWNTLTEQMNQLIMGNGGMSEDCYNTHIINELELPVKVLGVSNMIIAVSADGILVSDKPASSKMKDMLHEGLFSRPMYEERSWGWYRILDHVKRSDQEILTRKVVVHAAQHIDYEPHPVHYKVWTMVSGSAVVTINHEQQTAGAGNVIHIPVNTPHSLYATDEIELIEVQIGL